MMQNLGKNNFAKYVKLLPVISKKFDECLSILCSEFLMGQPIKYFPCKICVIN